MWYDKRGLGRAFSGAGASSVTSARYGSSESIERFVSSYIE